MSNIEFTETDFKLLEAKYPQGYWYLYSVALTRKGVEKEAELQKLKDTIK